MSSRSRRSRAQPNPELVEFVKRGEKYMKHRDDTMLDTARRVNRKQAKVTFVDEVDSCSESYPTTEESYTSEELSCGDRDALSSSGDESSSTRTSSDNSSVEEVEVRKKAPAKPAVRRTTYDKISQDTKDEIIEFYQQCGVYSKTAREFGLSNYMVEKIIKTEKAR